MICLHPCHFFGEVSLGYLSFAICTSPIISPCLPCMSIVFISFGTTLITKRKKRKVMQRGEGRGGSKHGLLWEMCKWWMPFSEKKDFLFWKSFFTRSRFQHFKQKKKEEYWNVNFTACNIYLTIEDNIQARLTFVTLWNLCIMINLSNKIAIWSCMDLL